MENIVSYKDVMKIVNRHKKGEIKKNWHGIIIELKYMLSREDCDQIPCIIIEKCKNEHGIIRHNILDLTMRYIIVSFYTNIELPKSLEDIYNLVYCTDIFNVVLNECNHSQIDNIIRLVGFEPYFVRKSICL